MLTEGGRLLSIEQKLDQILKQQEATQQTIESFNRRMHSFETTFHQMRRFTQESLTYIKRIQPFINKAMKTLHDAFRMVIRHALSKKKNRYRVLTFRFC